MGRPLERPSPGWMCLLVLVGTFNKGCITLGNFKLREGSFPALLTMWRCVVWMVYAVAVVCPPCCIHPILFILSSNFVWSDLGHLLRICRNQLPRQHTAPSLPALGQWKLMISYIFIYPSRVLVSVPVRCRCWFKVNVHGKYGILIISSNVPITTSLLCGFRAAQCRQPATLNISFFLKLMWRSSTFNFLCVKNVWFRQR